MLTGIIDFLSRLVVSDLVDGVLLLKSVLVVVASRNGVRSSLRLLLLLLAVEAVMLIIGFC